MAAAADEVSAAVATLFGT
ncbi:hypothetical protein BST45_00395 [Mycobacterium shinjukuense]|nr:hypothetical protein BST45_00395 [Mycobacterium shinjukuense]